MIARLYYNENLPLVAVHALRSFGHDVLTSHEAGNANQGIPDEDVLAYATANERAVITFNRQDFIRLHRLDANHAGIIVCTENPDFAALSAKVHAMLSTKTTLRSQLLRVNRGN